MRCGKQEDEMPSVCGFSLKKNFATTKEVNEGGREGASE